MYQELAADRTRDVRPRDHTVHVYADDLALTRELVRFVSNGLLLGESVVVVTGRERRAAISALLASKAIPARARESVVLLDTVDTLDKLMVDGVPDWAMFEAVITRTLDAVTRNGQSLRIFGDMVALLWKEGNVTGALELESLWNRLAEDRRFFVMCAYPASSLDPSPLRDIDSMRELHSHCWLLGLSTHFAEKAAVETADSSRLLIPIPLPATVSVVRNFAARTLVDWEAPHLITAADVITSELAGNAVGHAQAAYRLTVARTSTTVRIAVEDSGPLLDSTKDALRRIDAWASRCGCAPTPDGKTVWAELAISRRRSAE